MRFSIVFFFLLSAVMPSFGQIIEGQDTLYGNEWINYDQQYFKMLVAEDGMYKVTGQELQNAGVPISTIAGNSYQVFHNGKEIPIYTSTDQPFQPDDYLLFYGEKNRSELDRYLFKNPDEEMMNPRYSLITDSAAYFVTWGGNQAPLRFENLQNSLSNLPPKDNYYMEDLVLNYFSHWDKEQNSQGIKVSNFTTSEGYSSNFQNVQSFSINASKPFIGGPQSNLHIRYSGNLKQHEQLITLNGQALTTDEFYGHEVRQLDFAIENSLLTANMELKFQGLTDNNDKQRVSNIILTYPRLFDFENQTSYIFTVAESNTDKYLEIESFNAGTSPVLFDITSGYRIQATVENGLVKIKLPAASSARKLILVNEAEGVRSVASISPVSFFNYAAIDADFIFLTNPKLYDDGNGTNWVQEYADYRASTVGGSYKPVVVDIQQIYDQFGWGINRHPLSIRNFAHYLKKTWPNVKYFFIVGKGREYPSQRNSISSNFLVPTFGTPGSDNQLLAGSDGFTPVIPVGRIAAQNEDDIRIYLNKVKGHDLALNLPQTIEDRLWMKRILHLGGGLTAGEQSLIKNYLANMETTIEYNKFGGNVTSFFKTSSDPIQISQTEQIFNIINGGTSIISFFGHSGVGTFDFSIDNPDNFENQGKYPLIISLGCYSGNIHSSGRGISERFTFFENKGAMAFGATSGLGFISSLYQFAKEFYSKIGGENYGMGIGDALQAAIRDFGEGNFGVNLIRQQFSFHGDPSLTLYPSPGPDYVIDPTSVEFLPQRIDIQLDSFIMKFDVVNLGYNITDTLGVEITQELPDGQHIQVAESDLLAPAYRSSHTFTLPTLGRTSVGLNRFLAEVDVRDNVEELPAPVAEMNNRLVSSNGIEGVSVFISDNTAIPVYPPNFGIVHQPGVALKATTSDPLASERTYVIEIDTTELFNSPSKLATKITQPGGVLSWDPPLNWENEMVYYWRVSPDSLSPEEGFNWSNSSFIYLQNGAPGWNQSHYFQYLKDDFFNLEMKPDRQLEFISNFKDFNIKSGVIPVRSPAFYINNAYYGTYNGVPSDGGVLLLWLDSINVLPKKNYPPGAGPYQYGLLHPYGWWVSYFMFSTTHYDDAPNGRKDLIDFLDNVVAPGESIIFITVQKTDGTNYEPEEWAADSLLAGKNLFSILEAEGAQLIRQTATNGPTPYVFAYKKGSGKIAEELAASTDDFIDLNFGIPGNWDRGFLESPPIGPATSWTEIQWQSSSFANPETDTISLSVYATDPVLSSDSLLFNNIPPGNFDLSDVDAGKFPFLKLRFNSEDSLFKSSAQLDYWRVLYEGVPEFAFNTANSFSLHRDTLQQGDIFQLEFAVSNLSDFGSDSLLIEFNIQDVDNQGSLDAIRHQALSEQGEILAKYSWDTRQASGLQRLSVQLNPSEDQPELIHRNNFLNTTFYVEGDNRNPVLDVTFDGKHILNGDLVSARPLIRIEASDENEFLLMEDTTTFKVFITYPGESEVHRIYFSEPTITFFPASGTQNKARIEYRPVFEEDGVYHLIVQARDASGNQSGQYDYKVAFEIINKTMISNMLNYPNPFSTSTRFVYTLTGSESPDQFKIQIMTVSGKIVREITQDEIGPLKVGTHITDYAWDGRDEFGDQLANGVYLYRVVVKKDGKEVEGYETGADAFFKEGVGKMVLIR